MRGGEKGVGGGKEWWGIYLNLKDEERKWTLEILHVLLLFWNTLSPNARSGTTISLSFLGKMDSNEKHTDISKMDSSRRAKKRTVFPMINLKRRLVPAGKALLQLRNLPRPDTQPSAWHTAIHLTAPGANTSSLQTQHYIWASLCSWPTAGAQLIFVEFVCTCIHTRIKKASSKNPKCKSSSCFQPLE